MNVSLQSLLGKGFNKIFLFKGRYRICKGSRNSKKSWDLMGYAPVYDILSNEQNNVMVLRAIDKDNRQSTFSQIKKSIRNMGLWDKFKIKESTMEITYKPTGQKIFFRGCNDPYSCTSVSVEVGQLNKLYIEEAYQIKDYETFRTIDGSIRGKSINGSYIQITMVFNPWNINTWLYDEFFKGRLEDDYNELLINGRQDYCNIDEVIGFGKGLYLMINNYQMNEFRDVDTWDVAMNRLREVAPDIFRVEGLGLWGTSRSKTFNYFNDNLIKTHDELMNYELATYTIGIDIGMGGEGKVKYNTPEQPNRYRSAMTMSLVGLTNDYEKLIAFDEYFFSNQTEVVPKDAVTIADEMIEQIIMWKNRYRFHPTLMKGTICCYVDSADPGGFRTLLDAKAREKGLINVRFLPSTKNRIQTRVDFENLMMAFGNYLVCELSKNLIREIKNAHGDESGIPRTDEDDHIITANEYGWIPLLPKIKMWATFKER